MTSAVITLGANLGDRRAALTSAVDSIRPYAVSDVYETEPWGDDDQPPYLNLTMIARDDDRSAKDWLDLAEQCETAAGRVRDPDRRWGPRVLDVDIIAVFDTNGDPILSDDPVLTLPHPRAHLRAFVLVPWLAIQPDAALPGRGRVRDLLRDPDLAADARTLRRLGPLRSNDNV